MRKIVVIALAAGLVPACAWAVDGQVLINQATVMSAGGFPYKIKAPGSYKLSGNLTVSSAADGIDIESGGVTLDPNGFSITGPVRCTWTGTTVNCTGTGGRGIAGIVGTIAVTGGQVTLKNGLVQGFSLGIDLEGAIPGGTLSATLTDLQAVGNGNEGIDTSAGISGVVMVRCQALLNGRYGIVTSGATISESTGTNNGLDGFFLADSTTLTHSVASSNHQCGIETSGGSATLLENVVSNNGLCGLGFASPSPYSVLFGSNTITGASPIIGAVGRSQNNNSCNGSTC